MVIQFLNSLKLIALNTELVKQAGYGDLSEKYNHHSDIKYPYVHFELLGCRITRFAKYYKIRVYAIDRNKNEYLSYNKAEAILDNMLKFSEIDLSRYSPTFFKSDYNDMVNGATLDIELEDNLTIESNC